MLMHQSSPVTVIFSSFIDQLTIFYISGCVLYPAVVFYPPSPWRPLQFHSWWAERANKAHKLCANPYILIVNLLRTYIHTYIHTSTTLD